MQPTRICRACGSPIPRQRGWTLAYYAKRLYCNLACQRSMTPDIGSAFTVTETGCWEWQGRMDRNGYGKAYDPTRPAGQRVDWAHRVSYRRHKGEIPDRYEVDHTCENTRCINPDHLDAVTKPEHARRTMERLGKDKRHLRAAVLRAGGMTYREVAEALELSDKGSAAAAVQAAVRKGLIDADALPDVKYLDQSDYEDIAWLYALGVPQTEIAAWYGVDSSRVSRICTAAAS